MRNKKTLIFGAFVFILALALFLEKTSEKLIPASLFEHWQETSKEQIFIANDFVAVPGEVGEIMIQSGEGYPAFAGKEGMGMYLEFSFPREKIEFLGATLDNTIFKDKGYEISVVRDPSENKVQVTIWTSKASGVSVPARSNLVNIMLSVRENNKLGDEILIDLLTAEVVYDKSTLQSYFMNSLQGGVIRIGNPKNPSIQSSSSAEFFFENNILAQPGEERLILLKSGIQKNIAGLLFDLEFPESKLEFLGFETVGTALENSGFTFITEDEIQNHVGLLAATGSPEGASLDFDDTVLAVRFLVRENVPIGESIPLSLRKTEVVDADTLTLMPVKTGAGSILVSSVSSLALTDVLPLSSSSVRLIFSDEIIQANLHDIAFSPHLQNTNTAFEINGESIVVRNLTTMIPGQTYRVDLQEHIVGNIAGTLSPNYNFGFFTGFPSQYPMSRFRVKEAIATSNTNILMTFTDTVNPQSVEVTDFHIDGLDILSAGTTGVENNQVNLITKSQSALIGSSWLTLNNASNIHDIQSAGGELLSLNIISFTPFGKSSLGPQIKSISAKKPDIVEVTFDKPLLGSSLSLDDFTINEMRNTSDLITAQTLFGISSDHKKIIFRKVKTVAGRNYKFFVNPGSIQTNESGNTPIGLTGNIVSFIGQGSFFTPWDFGLVSAEATSPEKLLITFSEEVFLKEEFSPLQFEIWTRDTAENSRKLKVISAKGEKNTISLETEFQQEHLSYFVIVDDESIMSAYGERLGIPSSRGFFGFSSGRMRAVSGTPKEIPLGKKTEIIVTGVHFPKDAIIRIGSQSVQTTFVSETELKAVVPGTLDLNTYDIVVVTPQGQESRIPNGVTVIDEDAEIRLLPVVLSDESYASPFRIPNDGSTISTLWVRIQDPRGASDIEKVTADLRLLNGPASAAFTFHEFVNDKAWYKRDITVPSTVPTSNSPTQIPITVENKTGRKGFGGVEVLVNRDLESSLPPVIESALASPDQLSPGDLTKVTFRAEISDPDGGGNIARVVLDAGQVGLGILVLQPLDEIQKDRECTRNDYSLGEWSVCTNKIQRRIVDLKQGIECTETSEKKPDYERVCFTAVCTRSDWILETICGPCVLGKQICEYVKKRDSTCLGESEKPIPESVRCVPSGTSSFLPLLDILIPKAQAITVFGNRIWYQSDPFLIPEWISEGVYRLPITVIDFEGTEGKGAIVINISRNSVGSPNINGNDIFISPKHSIPNDGKTEFQIFAKVTDPNGHEDIKSVTVNLSPIGLPPTEMKKGQTEGTGAWYVAEKLTIPRSVIPGHRTLTVAATDIDQNVTEREFKFHVSTPETSGDGPVIPVDRAYTNPRTFTNNQEANGTLYVFVEEGDAEIAHVTANLGTILRYTGEDGSIKNEESSSENTKSEAEKGLSTGNLGGIVSASEKSLPGVNAEEKEEVIPVSGCKSTDTFGCMTPSVSEGGRGRWFYLSNLMVRKEVSASQNPYFISVVATDTDGRKQESEIPIYVSDGTLPLSFQGLPHLVSAVATERNEIQAFFSASIDPTKIRSDAFKISFFDDIHTHLPVRDIDIRSDGQVVIIQTNFMNPGDRFTLFADSEQLGLRRDKQTDNQVSFTVPSIHDQKKFFEIEKVTSISPNAVEIIFRKDLRFSSLLTDGANFGVITKGTEKTLPVYGAQISDSKTIILSTGIQVPGSVYILRASDLIDFSGKKLRKGTDIKMFPAFSGYGSNAFVVTKSVEREIVTAEEDVLFTTRISNKNNEKTYENVVITDTFPKDILHLSKVNTGGAFSCENGDGEIRCVLDKIPPGAEYTLFTRFKAIRSGSGLSTTTITSQDDTIAVSSANIAVIDSGNPFLIKKTPNKVNAGINEEIEFRVSLTNRTEGQTFINASVTDDFPEQLIKLLEMSPIGGNMSCKNNASEIECLIPTFAPGQTYTFGTKFVAIGEGVVTNTVVATAETKQNFANSEGEVVPSGTTTGGASTNVYIQNPFLNADFNNDQKVDFLDFSIFGTVYGMRESKLANADFNKDGKVDFLDFSIFAQQYGLTKETAPILLPEHEETRSGENQRENPQEENNEFPDPDVINNENNENIFLPSS